MVAGVGLPPPLTTVGGSSGKYLLLQQIQISTREALKEAEAAKVEAEKEAAEREEMEKKQAQMEAEMKAKEEALQKKLEEERKIREQEEEVKRQQEIELQRFEDAKKRDAERKRLKEKEEKRRKRLREKARAAVDADDDDTEEEIQARKEATERLKQYNGDVWDACKAGNVEMVRAFFLVHGSKKLLEGKMSRCHHKDEWGRTLLHMASWWGNIRVIEFLTVLGADVNATYDIVVAFIVADGAAVVVVDGVTDADVVVADNVDEVDLIAEVVAANVDGAAVVVVGVIKQIRSNVRLPLNEMYSLLLHCFQFVQLVPVN